MIGGLAEADIIDIGWKPGKGLCTSCSARNMREGNDSFARLNVHICEKMR